MPAGRREGGALTFPRAAALLVLCTALRLFAGGCDRPSVAGAASSGGPDVAVSDGPAAAAEADPEEGAVPLAVTYDDVPWNGGQYGRTEILERTDRLLGVLTDRRVPATAFVTCRNLLDDGEALRRWHRAGLEIGNHGWSHLDLNRTDPADWLADVRRCGERIQELTGRSPRFFRFPYLHEGSTPEVRDSVARALERARVRTAHVTIDDSEWVLARPYDRAVVAGDSAEMRRIGEAYVAHLRAAAAHFRRIASDRTGRETAQVLLLHAHALAADRAGALLDSLSVDGFLFVSLDEALSDPVFARPDGYAGPKGLSWLLRFEPAETEDRWNAAAEAELRERFGPD